ncbi:GNAT family N-acetyltransferase [Aneurinibacillus thermoaerophilus]|uniref:GNAT family N-acetyltransferase n=1 Tax=Aneurinibacillus thermoaerophilus TaxID=143495 RepID=UPI002E213818|nr:GNAT family N-acetyltransferase [Aneurinibacillus thermoaerophilus]MED0766124.1 GNAT family N-acetyltransferase [Aneurinibacillus thermoaerophilus]
MSYETIYSLTDQQVKELHAIYQSEWWTKGRQLPDIQLMLNHSLVIAFCDPVSKQLIAFSRVLTDYIYKALILDVIATPTYRGKGIGKALMDAIINHPSLKNVNHFELYCRPEMIPFYQRWGFTNELGELHFMRRT